MASERIYDLMKNVACYNYERSELIIAGAEGFEPPGVALEATRLAVNERP